MRSAGGTPPRRLVAHPFRDFSGVSTPRDARRSTTEATAAKHGRLEDQMPTIVVDVMPKAELLDPQGKAVAGALSRLEVDGISGVRIGKRFELTVDAADEATLAAVKKIADEILSNAVIEDVVGIEVVE